MPGSDPWSPVSKPQGAPDKSQAAKPGPLAGEAMTAARPGQLAKKSKSQKPEEGAKPLPRAESASDKHHLNVSTESVVVIKKKTPKQKALAFANGKYFVMCMLVATVIALFAMDIYEVAGPPPIETDRIMYVVMLVTFLLFMAEFSILTWAKPGYRFSFFWGLDLLAATSLIPDALMAFNFDLISMLGESTSALAITRAGRAARAGTRAVRIIEVVKKYLKIRKMKKMGISCDPDDEGESAIGGKLGDGITEKVIVIVTVMLIASQTFGAMETKTLATFELELRILENIYRTCRASHLSSTPQKATRATAGPGIRHGCSSMRLDCLSLIGTSDPTCHFNLYLRQLIASHNGVAPHCADLTNRAALDCKAKVFDEAYDFTTYSLKPGVDCQKQKVCICIYMYVCVCMFIMFVIFTHIHYQFPQVWRKRKRRGE